MISSVRGWRCVEGFAPIVLVAVLAAALAGCKTTQPTEASLAAAAGDADRRSAPAWAERCAPRGRARARRCRRLQTGARRARSGAAAGCARLAHPLGPGRRARSDGPTRGGAALLRDRAADRAGRALGAFESRALLCALQGPGAGGGDAATRGLAVAH